MDSRKLFSKHHTQFIAFNHLFLYFFVSLLCSNLNGRYSDGDYPDYGEAAVFWNDWLGYEISLKSVTIMVRPKSK